MSNGKDLRNTKMFTALVSRPRTLPSEGLLNHRTIIPGHGDLRSAISLRSAARSGDLRRARA